MPDRGVAGFQENFYISDELEARRARDKETCVLHRDRQVTQVCRNCDVLICDDCKATEHKGHGFVAFKNEMAAARKELNALLKELEGHSSVVNNALIRMPADERVTKRMIDDLRKDIDTKTNAWRSKLDKARAESLRTLDAFASARQGTYLKVQKEQQTTAVLLEQTRSALNDWRGMSVLAAWKKIKSELSDQNRTKNVITDLEKSFEKPSLKMNRLVDDVDQVLDDLSVEGFWIKGKCSGSSGSGSHRSRTDNKSRSDDGHYRIPLYSPSPRSVSPISRPSFSSSPIYEPHYRSDYSDHSDN